MFNGDKYNGGSDAGRGHNGAGEHAFFKREVRNKLTKKVTFEQRFDVYEKEEHFRKMGKLVQGPEGKSMLDKFKQQESQYG